VKVAVLLTTRCREDMTAETLRTFAAYHRLDRFVRLHGDDASPTGENRRLAAEHGFETVHCPAEQQGHMASFRALLRIAVEEGCDWALALENDWEWVRPTPAWARGVMSGGDWPRVDGIRLYGATKARSGPRAPTGACLMGTKTPIEWRPIAPGVEYTDRCHFAGPPAYWRTEALWPYVRDMPTFKAVGLVYQTSHLRAVENCVWHLGDTQDKSTPGHRQ
jgi:hypothetical protein